MKVYGKQATKFMMEENNKCQICGSNDLKKINFGFSFFRKYYDKYHNKYFCPQCCLVQMSPSPSENYLDSLYKKSYRKSVNILDKKDEIDIEFDWTTVSYSRFINLKTIFLKNDLDKNKFNSILDIGGYQGAFGFALKQFFETNDVTVSDYDENGLKLAKNYFGLKSLLINKLFKQNKKYHLISLVHVLEHIKEPVKYLKNVSSILDDNGVVYIEVPNNINFPFSDKTHLFEYSPYSLEKIINISNFNLIDMQIQGYPIINTSTYLSNSNISLLITKNNNTLSKKYESKIKKLSYRDLKRNHFVNDQKLIFDKIFSSLKLFFKMILYFIFSVSAFFFPKPSNYILSKLFNNEDQD
jgi:2-polyprenyl-3-methyl-5-hydroxy-6-metoxy-1,4-benzoquinol methylase